MWTHFLSGFFPQDKETVGLCLKQKANLNTWERINITRPIWLEPLLGVNWLLLFTHFDNATSRFFGDWPSNWNSLTANPRIRTRLVQILKAVLSRPDFLESLPGDALYKSSDEWIPGHRRGWKRNAPATHGQEHWKLTESTELRVTHGL